MNIQANTSADYNAFRDSVMRRPYADKLALVRELERETFADRFSALLERLRSKSNLPSLEEITKEVEEVRSARYNNQQ